MIDLIINTKINLSQIFLNRDLFQVQMVHLPSIEIKQIKPKEQSLLELENQLSALDWVVVSSVNSLKYAPKKIIQQIKKLKIPVAAVGKASGDYVLDLNLNLQKISPSSSINGLIGIKEITEKNYFLFIKGKEGNETFISELLRQHKEVCVLEVYQRKSLKFLKSDLSLIQNKKTLWLFYSQSALLSAYNNFKNNPLWLHWFLNQKIICLSQKIADQAREIGIKEIKIVDEMSDDGMIYKIKQSLN